MLTCKSVILIVLLNIFSEDGKIQEIQSIYFSYGRLIQCVFPCFLVMLWGSWGDKYNKRIPPMLVAIIGELVKNMLMLVCISVDHIPAEVTYLFQILIPAITGGNIVVQMAATSYLADITTHFHRTRRIGYATFATIISLPVGYFLSGVIHQYVSFNPLPLRIVNWNTFIYYSNLGFYGTFAISSILNIVNIAYLVTCVRESPKADNNVTIENTTFSNLLRDFFSWSHIQSTMKFALADTVENRKLQVFVLSLLVLFTFGPIYGMI